MARLRFSDRLAVRNHRQRKGNADERTARDGESLRGAGRFVPAVARPPYPHWTSALAEGLRLTQGGPGPGSLRVVQRIRSDDNSGLSRG